MDQTYLRDVTAGYGTRDVLRDISIEVKPGVTALLGNNGSGKSTLLRILATLMKVRRGEVVVAGHALSERSGVEAARRAIAYLDQRSAFPRNYTARQAVTYAAWLHLVPKGERDDAVSAALDATNTSEFGDRRLSELSGGTQQRVYIAQAIVHQPELLLLDEPTAGLDISQRHSLLEAISAISKRCSVLMATHSVEEVGLADRIIAIANGVVVADGTRLEILPERDHGTASERMRRLLDGEEVAA